MRAKATVSVAVVLAVFAVALLTGLARIDHFGGVYGVSVGTDSHYVSVEGRAPFVTYQSAS